MKFNFVRACRWNIFIYFYTVRVTQVICAVTQTLVVAYCIQYHDRKLAGISPFTRDAIAPHLAPTIATQPHICKTTGPAAFVSVW